MIITEMYHRVCIESRKAHELIIAILYSADGFKKLFEIIFVFT
jgi:hypothetical protein